MSLRNKTGYIVLPKDLKCLSFGGIGMCNAECVYEIG